MVRPQRDTANHGNPASSSNYSRPVNPTHPGTSGRSPPPATRGNRWSLGDSSGRPSLGGSSAHESGRSAIHLPFGRGAPPTEESASMSNNANSLHHPSSVSSPSAFFARLAPATAKFLRNTNPTWESEEKEHTVDHDHVIIGSRSFETHTKPIVAVTLPTNQSKSLEQPNAHLLHIGQDIETIQLRAFVQSLLGINLPTPSANHTTNRPIPTISTPDPTTAGFYALMLYAKTNGRRPDDAYLAARAMSLKGEGRRALWILDNAGLIGAGVSAEKLISEEVAHETDQVERSIDDKMETVGLEGCGKTDTKACILNSSTDRELHRAQPSVSNGEGIRNAFNLRTEAALLAGQCLVQVGDYEKALAVFEEAMRFPPPPPPLEWGLYGYGYRLDSDHGIVRINSASIDDNHCQVETTVKDPPKISEEDEENAPFPNLHDEMYIRQWREESLSHTALIDEGYDDRLIRLAEYIRPLPFSNCDNIPALHNLVMEGIHPMARLCAARGIAYDEVSNPHRAIPFLQMALRIDPRCIEALDHAIKKRLLTPDEERNWVSSLNWGSMGENSLGTMGISWLKDAYFVRLRGGTRTNIPHQHTVQGQNRVDQCSIVNTFNGLDGERILDASSNDGVGLQTPSALSLGVDFDEEAVHDENFSDEQNTDVPNIIRNRSSTTIDEAFDNLAVVHRLGKSSDILSCAAIRSYASHNLQAALAYCMMIDTLDPYCRSAGYVHVATLVGLGQKRWLFQLAHRLVDTDPKNALAWFAVGSYYHLCRRYDLAQRHFSRSTRLDPCSAECWIGFGCSFAVCDESDQALASFRAAHNKFSGSHIPLLYMGMEYLRTNHLSLAGHFLSSAQKTDPSDPLCCNEMGVWSFRRGEMEDAAFWFVKALRLQFEADSSSLASTDEALGINGFILINSQGSKWDSQGRMKKKKKSSTAPLLSTHPKIEEPPLSSVLCAMKTPSGQSIAVHSPHHATFESILTDAECVNRCKDIFWEPTIYNLGQSYRKLRRYTDAILCFEKCTSLNPGSSAAYLALGFSRHLNGDVHAAIDSYHEALSRKPDDLFSTEMLNRALAEAVTYPKASVFDAVMSSAEAMRQTSAIGSSILGTIGKSLLPNTLSG